MDIRCTHVEIRILGALIEKEITTPEYYPLSLNGLVNACNQKSNRDPVMTLDENEVLHGVDSLREKRLAWQLNTAGGRVPKYEHNLRSVFTLSTQEIALLCVLMLRGPQTPGELRVRTERMCTFASLEEVETALQGLISREDGPFVIELPRQPGHKESRFTHLFCGIPEMSSPELLQTVRQETIAGATGQYQDRIRELEQEIRILRDELQQFKAEFTVFKKQFD